MPDLGPIQQFAIAIAGLLAIIVGAIVVGRSKDRQQNYAENARIGFGVFMGFVIIAAGLSATAIMTGPGQRLVQWFTGLFA